MGDVAESFRAFVFLDRKQAREGLSPSELARWKALKRELSRELSGGCDDERADQRGSLRVPVKLRVSFSSMGELGQALMTNLSRGGLFVATDRTLEIGARVALCLYVEGAPKGLEVQAEVVTRNLSPRGGPAQGLGLRFVEVEGALRKQLDALYERALAAAGPRRR